MTYREALDDNMRRFYRDHAIYTGVKSTRHKAHNPSETALKRNLSGNILHISLPAGSVFEILNLLEISSPEGISLDARIPFLKGDRATSFITSGLDSLLNSIKEAGGTIDITHI